jgi:5-methylcytosine-specific restriction endonuclease McrA
MVRPVINHVMRVAIAQRYGVESGGWRWITCAYCPSDILIDWRDSNRVRFLDDRGRSYPELDHVEPLFWGGPHTVDNLVPACMSCNRSKGPRRLAVSL